MLVKGFRVFRPSVIFRHFSSFASNLLLICNIRISSNKCATKKLRHQKICYMLLHPATCCYTVLHKGEITMTASKHPIPKICVFCQEAFQARKMSTLYCSHKCASRAYKENKRQEKLLQNKEEMKGEMTASIVMIQAREVLSVEQVCLLLGVSRWTVSRMYNANKLKTITVGTRRLILREDLEKLLKSK